ncbi:MAG TPA: glycosyltransferase family 4 protein, partial [Terrimesophilobacter sp.]|nr:glycosyltransferase family 4 protein [Terrimesophilobacter sp.]
ETFGLVSLESAASGTPVVGFRGSGLSESIAHSTSGLLVDSRDPQAWAQVVCELLEHPPQLGRLSQSAREFALGHTWSASVTSLLGVYDRDSAGDPTS